MASSRQLAKIVLNGFDYRILMESGKAVNQYRIIRKWFVPGCGFKQETVCRYSDYTSCLCFIANTAIQNGGY